MHQGVDVGGVQPEVEGDVGVRGGQIGVVVAGFAVEIAAASGFDGEDDVAGCDVAEGEGFRASRFAPGGDDAVLGALRQGGEEAAIGGEVEDRGWRRGGERGDEVRRGFGVVAGFAQQAQHGMGAGEAVQADGVAELAGGVGVVRQHDGDAALGAGRGGEACPAGGAVGGEGDARGVGAVDQAGEFQAGNGRSRLP